MADVDVLATAYTSTDASDALGGPYWTSPSVGYVVLQNSTFPIDVYKTADSGATWAVQDAANNPASANNRSMAVWWDQETPGNSGTVIHIAWVQTTEDEVHYISFDTNTDAYGTNRTVDALAIDTNAQDNDVGITVAKSGRVYICARGDWALDVEGTDHSMLSSDDSGASWDARTSPYSSDEESVRLYPGAETDEDDIYAVVYDVINRDLEFWKYDATATTWGVTAIDAGTLITSTEIRGFKRLIDAAVRISDSHLLVAYWNDVDVASADLRCVDIEGTTPTVTQKTNIDTDTDDSALAGVLINQQNDDVYVAYVGSDAGDEFWEANVRCYFKKSADGMGSWSAEQAYGIESDDLRCVSAGRTVGNAGGRVMPAWFNDDLNDITVNDGNDVEIAAAEAAPDIGWLVRQPGPVRETPEVVAY